MAQPSSRDEGIRVIRAGFARVLLDDVVFDCTAPIYWFSTTGGRRGPILNNGTVFFVDAGQGLFAVTARHVVDGFRRSLRDDKNTECEIGGVGYSLLDGIIADDASADIATLTIHADLLAKVGRAPHVNPGGWPPTPPEAGKGVFFGGYPGRHRIEVPGAVQWGFAGGLDVASSVRDESIAVRFAREDWVSAPGLDPPGAGEPWGGVSGGPLFAVVQTEVMSWRLAGVVTEFGTNFEILYASSLSRVRCDGSISR